MLSRLSGQIILLFTLTLLAILGAYQVGFAVNTVVSIWPAAAVIYWAIKRYGFTGFVATVLAGCAHSILWLNAPLSNLLIPITSSLAAWLGIVVERRISESDDIFSSTRAMAAFLLAGMGLLSLVSALAGNVIIILQYDIPWSAFGLGVWNWFLGDYTGGLMLAPLLLQMPKLVAQLRQWQAAAFETAMTLLLLALITVVYLSEIMIPYGPFSPMFLALPGAIILATRKDSARVSLNYFLFTMGALVTIVAIGGNGEDNSGLLTVQLYLTIVMLCGLILHSMRTERGRLLQELAAERQQLEIRVQERTAELAQEVSERQAIAAQMEALARIDPLTGLFNRRYFAEVAARDLKRARRGDEPVSLCILDVDHFKQINDTHGHPSGDAVLTSLAEILLAETRNGVDSVVRLGGEEFAILMPKTQIDLALEVTERIRKKIAEYGFETATSEADSSTSIAVTISAGVIECPLTLDSIGPAINTADKALYQAKRGGRNRVIHGQFELQRSPRKE